MIIKSLVDYYNSLGDRVPKNHWASWDVSGVIELDNNGNMIGIYSLLEQDENRKNPIRKSMVVPQAFAKRTRGKKANFLCDKAQYILGISSVQDEGIITDQESFDLAYQLHKKILGEVDNERSQAVLKYFESLDLNSLASNKWILENLDIISQGNFVFRVNGSFVEDDEKIQQVWDQYMDEHESGIKGRCLVTGEEDIIPEIHLGIKRFPGAQADAALVSFNDEAYNSYGLERNQNSSIGNRAAFKYVTALNYLLNEENSHTRLGNVMFVYWGKNADEQYQEVFNSLVFEDQSDDEGTNNSEDLIDGIFKNLSENRLIDTNLDFNEPFHVIGLTPNSARISVQFYLEDSFGSILQNIKNHFTRMEMVRPKYIEDKGKTVLHFYEIVFETVNKNSKDKLPDVSLVSGLVYSVLTDTRYPETLYTDIIRRIRAEQGNVNWERASIIRAFLIKNRRYKEEDLTVKLNENSTSEAYNLGRLFSVLEKLQEESADTELNTTIKDRYFSSAAASPARVFPLLVIGSDNHLKKLHSKNPGRAVNFDKWIGTIIGNLNYTFPKMLDMDHQGEFVIGYYQQRQKLFEKKDKECVKEEQE